MFFYRNDQDYTKMTGRARARSRGLARGQDTSAPGAVSAGDKVTYGSVHWHL